MTTSTAAIPLTSFQDIRAQWLELLSQCSVNTFYLMPQWQEVWWDAFHEGREMAGFYLKDGIGDVTGNSAGNGTGNRAGEADAVAAIASLSRQGESLSFVGSTETFDYNDFMVLPGREDEFFAAFLDWLEREEWGVLELPSLIEGSPTLEYLPELARRHGYNVEITEEDVTPGLALPSTWDEYLSGLSKKNRHELRRKLRRLESVEGWRWYCVQDPAAVADRLDDFLVLMRQSDPEKDAYMTEEREAFFRRIAERTAQLDMLRLYFLEMDGGDVATSLCFDYNGTRFLYNSGYNPEYGYYSVGLLLNALCLREAIEQHKSYFDFLRGPEPYKYHLGGLNRTIYRMVVSKPTAVNNS